MATKKKVKPKGKSAARAKGGVALLVGTRKGAFIFTSDAARKSWKLKGPMFLGHMVYHVVSDPRAPRTLLLAARTGHLGPSLWRSSDFGKSWTEAKKPPAFAKAPEGEKGRTVQRIFWLTPGHASEPGVWYAGSSPTGLFRTDDGGDTWAEVAGWNNHPMRATWCGPDDGGTPDGPCLHSILIDPRDKQHMYFGASSGGVFETTDGGAQWQPLNKGCAADFMPDPDPEYGHDPHCVQMHPLDPDLLYQQNHCGIYRMQRQEARWERIGNAMPKNIGDIGFGIVLHPRDPKTAWVHPMDGTSVWPRTSPGGKPAMYVTRNSGKSWQRQDSGLPKKDAWLTVLRQSMSNDQHDPLGLYFGTTSGELWSSRDEGKKWSCVAQHLPNVFSVEAVELGR